ncbi:MAG: hypothetical protein CMF61_07320 [Magnetococcales bacterium]|nr:hypothetical protein [Magnetococcales bacterium]
MKKYIFIILAILIASPFVYSEFFGYTAPKQSEVELEAFKEKIRIDGGNEMVKFHSKKIVELLPEYKENKKDLKTLQLLSQTHWMLSRGYNQLHEYEKAKEPYAQSLKYLTEYEQAMEEAWPQRHEKITDSNILHIIKFYIHLNPVEEKEKYWKQKWLDLNLEKWERGERTYAVAHWIMTMYSHQQEWDYETGRQASMPQIQRWGKEMRRIGKPENYSRGQPW